METGKPSKNRVGIVAQMTEEIIERAVNCAHSLWPAWARAVPDFTDDHGHKNERKLAVAGFAQTDCYSCGFTAALAVVRTFHPRANASRLYSDCNPRPFVGMTEGSLVRALRRHGVGVAIRSNLNYQSIRAAIESGFPLVAGIGNGMFEDGDHWIVIHGVGWKPNRIFISNQPRIGNSREELAWDKFRSMWTPQRRGLICWGKRRRG
jgi:hypothetical protein